MITYIKGKIFSPFKKKDIIQNHYTENAKFKNSSFYNELVISTHFRIIITVKVLGKYCVKLGKYFAQLWSPFHINMSKTCPTRAYNCPKIVRIHNYQQVGHFLPIFLILFYRWEKCCENVHLPVIKSSQSHPSLHEQDYTYSEVSVPYVHVWMSIAS